MSSPPKNVCGPANIYGGFTQTLFLGCSVMSFSASQGWNEQVAEITVQLVQDTCTAPVDRPKLYYDTNLSPQTTTDADPGFYGTDYEIIGTPVFFRMGLFEFSGIVQSWEQSGSISGSPTYQVKIVDPRQILEGTQVIIGEYAGSVGNIYNLINAFGYAESTGAGSCPEYYQSAPGVYSLGSGSVDGTVFGSPATKFGGADSNANGMQWNQILVATRLLTASYPVINNIFSPYGRLIFKGLGSYPAAGMGIMPADTDSLAYYYLDLEDVPAAPTYWRLNGTNTGLMDAISQVCQDSGHDYYVELIPVVDGALGAGIHKFIKVRTVNRVLAPALGKVDVFILGSGMQRVVQNYTKGKELRNEITSSFVIGGPKQSFYQAEQNLDPEGDGDPTPPEGDDIIVPYFGLDPTTGDVIMPKKDANGWWEIEAPTYDLAMQLGNAKYGRAIAATLTIGEKELIAAASGFDSWIGWASEQNTDLYQALNIDMGGVFNIQHAINLVKNVAIPQGAFRPADLLALRPNIFPAHDSLDSEVAQIGFAWIEKFATEYYGKKYQVRVPFTCGKSDSESGAILTSEEPTDGGWTEVTPVLQLTHPSIYTDFFTLDDNRLGAFCRFNNSNGLELSGLNVNDFVTYSTKAWMKVDVEPEYVYWDKDTLFSPRAIITLPEKILSIELIPDVNAQWAQIINLLTEFRDSARAGAVNDVLARMADIQKKVGALTMHLASTQRAVMPNAVGFGIKSNILRYGPWGSAGPSGAVSVRSDEGLVPWEYGGFTTLDLAGDSIADEAVTNTQIAEQGSITVTGYPDLPLGSELLAADTGGPFYGGTGPNLIENRSVSAGGGGYYYMPIYQWSGTYGPNITGITVQVGTEGLTTQYNIKTWTPKFGIFARGNAERIKQIGLQRLSYQKQLRAWTLERLKRRQLAALNRAAGDKPGIKLDAGVFGAPKTPHEVLVGQLIGWNSDAYKRPVVETTSTVELPVEMSDDYDVKAFMSLDGLVRPVSRSGDGSLPRYAVPKGTNCQHTYSRGAQPPVDHIPQAGSLLQYNVNHSQGYLDPFSNPSGTVVTNLSDTPNHGHDIEIVGRGSTPPASSLMMPIQGYADSSSLATSDYETDYRMLALRGPLLLHSWGYDLDGFPVPNKADTEGNAASGVFTDENLQCKFLDNWLRKSNTWPVAPVDLRFDRDRGVWTIPQYRHIVCLVSGCIPAFGNGVGLQISGPTLYDCNGYTLSDPGVLLYDEVGFRCLTSGTRVIAEFDPYECKYRILTYQQNHMAYDICCTGDYSGQSGITGFQWDKIIARTGLRASSTTGFGDPNCPSYCADALILDSNLKIADHNECFPPSGYPRATIGKLYGFEALAFGAGLWVTPATGSGAAGQVGAAGVELGTCITGGTSLECLLHVQAGFRPVNNSGLCNPTGTLTSDGTRYINVVDFQRGMRAKDGSNMCDLLLSAGIEPYQSYSSTVTGLEPLSDDKRFKNRFYICKGLRVKDNDSDVCALNIGAGVIPYQSAGCVTGITDLLSEDYRFKSVLYFKDGLRVQDHAGVPEGLDIGAGIIFYKNTTCYTGVAVASTGLKNMITLGAGLYASDTTDTTCTIGMSAGPAISSGNACVTGKPAFGPATAIELNRGIYGEQSACTLKLGGGFEIGGSDTCVTSTDENTSPHVKLVAGRGLEIKHNANCEAEIGLYFDIDGNKAAAITLGNCLKATAGSCAVELDFNEGYGSGTVVVSQDVLTGITYTCCPSGHGTGINMILWSTSSLNFNSCGQLISITAGASGSGALECCGCDYPGSTEVCPS